MNRGLAVLVAAAVCGTGTMFGARQFLNTGPAVDPENEPTPVIMAATDIKAGSYLSEVDGNNNPLIVVGTMPRKSIPPGALIGGQEVIEKLSESKRWAKDPIPAGLPILASMMGKEGTVPGIRAKITDGHRGVSIPVTADASVAGFVMPEDRVDIVAHYPDRTAKVLMQNVRVLAVGEHLMSNPEQPSLNYTNMTFDITPREAFELREVSGQGGVLSMLLRGNDAKDIPADQLTWRPADWDEAERKKKAENAERQALQDQLAKAQEDMERAKAEAAAEQAKNRAELAKAKDEADGHKAKAEEHKARADEAVKLAGSASEELAKLKNKPKSRGTLVITDKVYRASSAEAATAVMAPPKEPAAAPAPQPDAPAGGQPGSPPSPSPSPAQPGGAGSQGQLSSLSAT